MHRHGYKGTKFGRERDQRRALIKSLADSLILNESVATTLPKAKAVVSYTERLITKAKRGDLHSRRQVIKALATKEAALRLFDEISPKLGGRSSGYFRITKSEIRRGDAVQLAKVAFVDDLAKLKAAKADAKPTVKPKTAAKKPPAKKEKEEEPTEQTKVKTQKNIEPHMQQIKEPPKRSGRRGNR